MGFTQRQAGGKFSRDEAAAFIAQLQDAEPGEAPTVAAPAWKKSTQEQLLQLLSSEQLAGESTSRMDGDRAGEPEREDFGRSTEARRPASSVSARAGIRC